jgi:hypothetical protein
MGKDQHLAKFVKLCKEAIKNGNTVDSVTPTELKAAAKLLELSAITRWGIADLASVTGAGRKSQQIAKDVYDEYMNA